MASDAMDAMKALQTEHERLEKKGNLKKTINDVQKLIDSLVQARNAVAAGISRILSISTTSSY